MTDKEWTGRTGGTRRMQRILIAIFRKIDPVWLYPLMAVWVVGYILFRPIERRGIWHYWRYRQGKQPLSAAWHLLCNYMEFGKAILDRFAAWAGRPMQVVVRTKDLWQEMVEHPTASVVLGAHIGNMEIAGYAIQMPKPVYTLVYMGDTDTVNTNRQTLFERKGLHIIPIEKDGSHILTMHQVVDEGNILSVQPDRVLGGIRTLTADFMGEEALFPEGTFRLAVAEQVPVIALYIMREGHSRYAVYVYPLSDGQYTSDNHHEQAKELLQSYVRQTEQMLRLYPHQWFNFYPFWQK